MKYKYILFDLDGTVSQSAEGIRASLEYAVDKIGCKKPDFDDYTLYIGPPLIDTFMNLCGLGREQAKEGSALYRSFYDKKGKLLNRAYDGIRETLQSLAARGARLAVCTSKYEQFAEEIIGLLELESCFDAVCGSTIDGSRKDKKDLIPYAVQALGGSLESDRDSTVMIGDTWFDAEGAAQCGVDFIGASYGYGDEVQMTKHGARVFADSPGQLLELLI